MAINCYPTVYLKRPPDTLSDTLNPVEIVLKKLCSDGINILKAEASITFLLSKMKSMQNCFAAQLHQSLLQRYSQRRQIEAISLCKYLHNPSYLHNDTMFSINSKAMIKKCAQQTVTRLFEDAQTSSSETEVIENTHQQSGETEEKDFYEEYAKTLEKFDSDAQSLPCKPGMNKELKYFEETGNRCSNIKNLHKSMLTIQATSVQAERGFSASGLFLTKLRTSLSEDTLDALCFLRDYFNNHS